MATTIQQNTAGLWVVVTDGVSVFVDDTFAECQEFCLNVDVVYSVLPSAYQAPVSRDGRRYKLGGRCGLLASPVSTATVAGAVIFALPESIKIPAGWVGANSRIYYDVRVRRPVAASAATNVLIRLGTANTNADPVCGLLSLPTTLNSDGRAFGSIDAASNTTASFNSYGSINGSTTSSAQDITAGINFAVNQYLNIGVSGTNGDQVSLIAYSFYLEV